MMTKQYPDRVQGRGGRSTSNALRPTLKEEVTERRFLLVNHRGASTARIYWIIERNLAPLAAVQWMPALGPVLLRRRARLLRELHGSWGSPMLAVVPVPGTWGEVGKPEETTHHWLDGRCLFCGERQVEGGVA